MGPLLLLINRDLFIVNFVLLYTQLIRHMIDYVCLLWIFLARTNVGRLKVLHSLWYIVGWRIHKNFVVLFLAEHIRALAASFDSNGKPLFLQIS
jgi:hypothetical protein